MASEPNIRGEPEQSLKDARFLDGSGRSTRPTRKFAVLKLLLRLVAKLAVERQSSMTKPYSRAPRAAARVLATLLVVGSSSSCEAERPSCDGSLECVAAGLFDALDSSAERYPRAITIEASIQLQPTGDTYDIELVEPDGTVRELLIDAQPLRITSDRLKTEQLERARRAAERLAESPLELDAALRLAQEEVGGVIVGFEVESHLDVFIALSERHVVLVHVDLEDGSVFNGSAVSGSDDALGGGGAGRNDSGGTAPDTDHTEGQES